MQDMIAIGEAWFRSQRREHLATEVSYQPTIGTTRTVRATAVVGRWESIDAAGQMLRTETQDFFVDTTDLAQDPKKGDRIVAGGFTYEVMVPPGAEHHWRWSDRNKTLRRIHTMVTDGPANRTPAVPGPPTAVVGVNDLPVTWTAPVVTGEYAVTSYKVYAGDVLQETVTAPSTTSVGTWPGGTVIRVSAVNAIGEGEKSSPVYLPLFPLFVFTGESNSGGLGLNSQASAEELAPRSQLQILNNSSLVFEALDIGTNNLLGHGGLESYFTTCHGIELQLANQVVAGRWPKSTAYLVKTGQGGSKIALWLNNAQTYAATFSQRVATAMQLLEDNGIAYRPVVFMSIGINDAFDNTDPATFKSNVKEVHGNIRSVLGSNTLIVMTLFESPIASYQENDEINDVIRQIASEDSNVLAISTAGFQADGGSHWSYAGLKSVADAFRTAVFSNAADFSIQDQVVRVPPKSQLAAWYDAADRGAFFIESGKVSSWYDKSGNSRTATQSTPGNRPSLAGTLNGRSTVAFSAASTNFLNMTYSGWSQNPLTIYVLYKATKTSSGLHTSLLSGGSNAIYVGREGSADAVLKAGSGTHATAAGDSGWRLLRYSQSGSTWNLSSNANTASGTNGPTYASTSAFQIGSYASLSSFCLDGEMAEMLIYNTVTDAATDQRVRRYIQQKWGV